MFSRPIFASLILALILAPSLAQAWNEEGHMVIAQIAWDRLTPETKAEVGRLIAVKVEPADAQDITSTFTTAACWADDVKRATNTGIWHYIDIPFSLDGTTPQIPPSDMDVVKAINNSETTIKDAKTSDNDKATALRYLIHFVGDVHQPLHCSDACSKAHPDGDRGGNSFRISNWNGVTNLHYLWDDGVGVLMDHMDRPLNTSDTQKLAGLAQSITSQIPYSVVQGTSTDPMAWANEGFAIAKGSVYVGIQNGGTPDRAYVTKSQKIVREQLARAGYRLADTLNALFDVKTKASSNVKSVAFLAYN